MNIQGKQEHLTAREPMSDSVLFSPVKLGPYTLGHRVVLAPLTRMRTVRDMIPSELMVEYYAQRATAGGFMLTEATVVSPDGSGYYGSPGMMTDAQQEGWVKVVKAVHKKGARIFNQLFHVGRESHVELQPGGALPVGPSVVPHGDQVFTPNGWQVASPGRALEVDEIRRIVRDFGEAARRAKAAGFDGVELHGANGYLINQFLDDGANKRTDMYGGSKENRVRFLLEVVEAVVAEFGADRIAVRVSPSSTFGAMSDSDPVALYNYVAERLSEYGLAYLHVVEPRVRGSVDLEGVVPVAAHDLKQRFQGTVSAAGGFDRDGAETILRAGDADLVAFGRHFIANPDLPQRFRLGLPLNEYDRATFYGGDAHGYTDYPFYKG
jgi:N-ethylmaleimide reductase